MPNELPARPPDYYCEKTDTSAWIIPVYGGFGEAYRARIRFLALGNLFTVSTIDYDCKNGAYSEAKMLLESLGFIAAAHKEP